MGLSSLTLTAPRPASRCATSSVFGATRPSSTSTLPTRRARTTRAAATWLRSRSLRRPSWADDAHQALLKELQATFKESQEKLEKLKEDSAPQIKLLKAATPSAKAGKDEV